MEFRAAQQLAWKNKKRKGFNTTNVPLELCLLQGEIAEFFAAWRRGEPGHGEELADIAIYLLGLAEMVGVDLDDQVERKILRNDRRVYVRQNGVLVKAAEGVESDPSDTSAP